MNTDEMINLFKDHIDMPEDKTDCYWIDEGSHIRYSVSREHLFTWQSNQKDIVSEVDKEVVAGDYVLLRIGSFYEYHYQAIFDLRKKVIPTDEDLENLEESLRYMSAMVVY